MTVWSHLTSFFGKQHILRKICLALLTVAITTTVFFAHAPLTAHGASKTIGFQGRLTSRDGIAVPDGNYNMQFKIYEGGEGDEQANPGGSLKWHESYINNSPAQGIQVKNGVFLVNLGSENPLDGINWSSASKLWLSINIAGEANSVCTDFDTCDSDGEMLPMKQITATPFSLDSGAVGGKSVGELVHLGQSTIQQDSTNNTSISINKTGEGGFMDLRNNDNSVFSIDNSGTISLGEGASAGTISMGQESESSNGTLTLSAGLAGSGDGGDLVLKGGVASEEGENGKVIVDSDLLVVGDIETEGTVKSTALNIESGGKSLLNVNSDNNHVTIGGNNPDALLVLNSTTPISGEPEGVAGAMYYNSGSNKFRCYEGGWKDCITPLPVAKVIDTDSDPYENLSDVTPEDVDGLLFTLAPNTSYYYKFVIRHNSTDAESGIGFGVTAPDGTTLKNWCTNTSALGVDTVSNHWGSYCGTGDASIATEGDIALGLSYISTMEGYIETGETIDNDPLQLRMISQSGKDTNDVVIEKGSFGILQIVQKETP